MRFGVSERCHSARLAAEVTSACKKACTGDIFVQIGDGKRTWLTQWSLRSLVYAYEVLEQIMMSAAAWNASL